MTLHNPPHPGQILRDGVLSEDRLSVAQFARCLGVSRVSLSRMLHGHSAVSASMALRLAAALGGSAEVWLELQSRHDLWQARRKLRSVVAKIKPIKSAN